MVSWGLTGLNKAKGVGPHPRACPLFMGVARAGLGLGAAVPPPPLRRPLPLRWSGALAFETYAGFLFLLGPGAFILVPSLSLCVLHPGLFPSVLFGRSIQLALGLRSTNWNGPNSTLYPPSSSSSSASSSDRCSGIFNGASFPAVGPFTAPGCIGRATLRGAFSVVSRDTPGSNACPH